MDVRENCDELVLQLALWRQELFDVAVTAEHFHSRSREVVGKELKELMLLVDAIGKKVDAYRNECENSKRIKAETAGAVRA